MFIKSYPESVEAFKSLLVELNLELIIDDVDKTMSSYEATTSTENGHIDDSKYHRYYLTQLIAATRHHILTPYKMAHRIFKSINGPSSLIDNTEKNNINRIYFCNDHDKDPQGLIDLSTINNKYSNMKSMLRILSDMEKLINGKNNI